MKIINRTVLHLRRILRAYRFGVPFVRCASFKLPKTVRLGDEIIPVTSPLEHGAHIDFIGCFLSDEYGLSKTNFSVKTIVDIGANIGFFSMAARSYFPAATIHAYEPNPRVFSYLSKNAAAAQFTLFAEAVGARAGSVSMVDLGDSNQARTLSSSDSDAHQVPQISFSTLVERLGGQVDLAKIDCEGAEWELFTDSEAWAGIRHVRMEYHLWGQHTFEEVEQALHQVGFEIHHHIPSGEWGIVWARNVKA